MNPKSTLTLIAMSLCAAIIMASPAYAIGKPYKNFSIVTNPVEEKPVKKTKADRAKDKAFSSLNNASVKIYPDAIRKMMHVSAKENDGKQIDFYVFDVEGTMVQNYKMSAKDHIRIQGLKKGSYVYRVFCGDEETAAGKFEIR